MMAITDTRSVRPSLEQELPVLLVRPEVVGDCQRRRSQQGGRVSRPLRLRGSRCFYGHTVSADGADAGGYPNVFRGLMMFLENAAEPSRHVVAQDGHEHVSPLHHSQAGIDPALHRNIALADPDPVRPVRKTSFVSLAVRSTAAVTARFASSPHHGIRATLVEREERVREVLGHEQRRVREAPPRPLGRRSSRSSSRRSDQRDPEAPDRRVVLHEQAARRLVVRREKSIRVSRSRVYVNVEMTRSTRPVVSSGSREGVGAHSKETRFGRPNAKRENQWAISTSIPAFCPSR